MHRGLLLLSEDVIPLSPFRLVLSQRESCYVSNYVSALYTRPWCG